MGITNKALILTLSRATQIPFCCQLYVFIIIKRYSKKTANIPQDKKVNKAALEQCELLNRIYNDARLPSYHQYPIP